MADSTRAALAVVLAALVTVTSANAEDNSCAVRAMEAWRARLNSGPSFVYKYNGCYPPFSLFADLDRPVPLKQRPRCVFSVLPRDTAAWASGTDGAPTLFTIVSPGSLFTALSLLRVDFDIIDDDDSTTAFGIIIDAAMTLISSQKPDDAGEVRSALSEVAIDLIDQYRSGERHYFREIKTRAGNVRGTLGPQSGKAALLIVTSGLHHKCASAVN